MILLYYLVLFFLTIDLKAEEKNSCIITREIWSLRLLPESYHSNDLSSPNTTSAFLKGKIMDVNCTPVSNAKIRIWTTDSKNINSGTAFTDNLGNFNFLISKTNKNFIVKVNHVNFKDFETKILLKNYNHNKDSEKNKNALVIKNVNSKTSKNVIYYLPLTLKESENYKN